MYDFQKNLTYTKAIKRIEEFNPTQLTKEDNRALSFMFPTGSRTYISSALRGFELQHIPLEKLIGFYRKIAMIDDYIRSHIAIALMYKLHIEQEYKLEQLEEVKTELVKDMTLGVEEPLEQNFEVVSLIYLLKISIGTDYFYKYGITANLNNRLRSLKSDIKSQPGYRSRSINIEVIQTETEIDDIKSCEQDIKFMVKKRSTLGQVTTLMEVPKQYVKTFTRSSEKTLMKS